MKSLFLLLVRSLLTLWITSQPAWAVITIDPPTRTFTKDGGGGSILTSGTGTWTATADVPWLTITPRTTGDAGQSCIYVVASNFSADTRQGVITLDGNTHTVTQTGYTATLSPTSGSKDLDGGSGSVSITLAPGVSWSATSNAGWVTVAPSSGIGSGSVTYTVAPYTGVTTRTASLTIAGRTFTISQTGADVNLSPREVEKAYSSDIVQVQVSALASTIWSVTSEASWISVVDPGNGFGDSTVTLAVGTNPSFLERNGTVAIGTASFSIRQLGTPNPALDILPKEATADPVGAYGNVAVLATPDAGWTASSLSPWIVIAQGTSGEGNGNIQYVASANPGLTQRVGTIEVVPPVYLPKVDLTRGLIGWYLGRDDLTGWERHLENAFDDFSFDGRTKVYVNTFGYGDDDYHRGDAACSISFAFEVMESGTTQRLFAINHGGGNESVIYVNEQDKLVVAVNGTTYVSNHTVLPNLLQQVLLTQDASRQCKLYFGTQASGAFITSPMSFTLGADFFPAASTKAALRFGYSDFPSPGILTGELRDFRIYARAVNADEAKALNERLITEPYSRYRGIATGRTWDDAAACSSRDEGDYLASPETQYEANLLARFGEDSLESKFAAEASVPGSGWNYGAPWIGARADDAWLKSGFPRFDPAGFVYNGYYTSSYITRWWDPFITIRSNGSLFDEPDGSREYFSETEIPGTVTSQTRNNYLESNASLLYRNEFKANGLGAIRLPFRLKDATWAADRLGRAQSALKWVGTTGSFSFEGAQAPHTTPDATYALWLKFNALPDTDLTLIDRRQVETQDPRFRVILQNQGTVLKLIINDEPGKTATFPISLTTTRFHHLALSCHDENSVKVILDGSEIGNTPLMTGYKFGAWQESFQVMTFNAWNGTLDDFATYDSALSVAEIRAIYDLEKPRNVYHTVTQGVVQPTLSPTMAELPAAGGTASSALSLPLNVTWTAETGDSWLSILSPTDSAGPVTLEVQADANPTVYTRTGTVTIAGQTFTVSQQGLNATVQHDDLIFGTDGGSGWIDVAAEGNGIWQAVSNDEWLTVAIGESGVGSGSVFIVADPYTQTTFSRIGSVTIAGQTIYITQRGYELSISPQVALVGSNAGAGEFGVAAPIGSVWEAIVTQPWITLNGGVSGVGNGTLHYSVAENTSGVQRTGRIIVSGAEYTITQKTSLLLAALGDGNGTVAGDGSYQTNDEAILTATPNSGFVFSHWTGDAVGSANPLTVLMDSSKTVTANFVPDDAADAIALARAAALNLVPQSEVDAAVQEVLNSPNNYDLFTTDQMHGLALGRPVLEKDPITGQMHLQLGLRRTSDLQIWQELSLPEGDVGVSGGKVDIQITPEGNAAFYRLEGSEP